MKIHVENILSPYYDVIDKDTNKRIPYVIWANDRKNIYKTYKLDKNKNIAVNKENKVLTDKVKKSIKIVRKYSYIYIFFYSMWRIFKQLILLRSIEKRKVKILKKLQKQKGRK